MSICVIGSNQEEYEEERGGFDSMHDQLDKLMKRKISERQLTQSVFGCFAWPVRMRDSRISNLFATLKQVNKGNQKRLILF
ncbi:MAG: hypothetical protein TQ37_01250 [Candidatus Synechococcus spongiarum 15L]|uniref:Uncharacterized protein n=1 Tax=Candidatus Synechococcus spongiarum 15L TaxID=1608419 RepID=A0A0G8AZF9_9SYNE|nr:MAG: hypothetical protein TQ37_01250 [Candidatus Synechococcus spongiarum 15L]